MINITVNKQTFMKTWWETYMCARPNTLLLPHSQHRPLCFWESPTCTTTLKTHYKHWTTETVQKSQLLQQQKIDTTIRTFKGRLFKDPNDDILDETLTTMERTWTNTDTYGTVFEILKSWDPSTKLDSSKDQWKYTHTMHIWRTREKEAQGIIAQTAKRAFGDRQKKENGEQGMRMCVRKQWWNAQGPNVLTWLQVEITWGSKGVEQQRSLRFLFLRCIAAQMVSPVWSQACAFCAGLAAVSAPEPEVPLEPSMEGH